MDYETLQAVRFFIKDRYFHTLDNNLPNLGRLFRESTVITFDGGTFVGEDALPDYLASPTGPDLSYSDRTVTVDAHLLADGTILALARGRCKQNGELQHFVQTFILVQDGDSYYVAHGIYQDIADE
ncbi:ketosteroid isomerase family protein [Nonomuraea angiospora]|uniref:ketosteroid isomerase family protein n=1 Tax=Nonomuraea angiospora TaxID=46172 RepID=UPI00332F9916